MSKIQSESNSQLPEPWWFRRRVVTNMSKIQSESNSQLDNIKDLCHFGCDQYVKDTIWKQFTTLFASNIWFVVLWPICQRYNLKAIHNQRLTGWNLYSVVTNMSKIQSESNSQRAGRPHKIGASCDQYVKDTIWKQFTTHISMRIASLMLWPICQRYNLKAIHNTLFRLLRSLLVVTNMSKIQSESNSQLPLTARRTPAGCDQYVKDTIWKQFTTHSKHKSQLAKLWPICQRYNLKAIHNQLMVVELINFVVTNMSKIQSESNSQPNC